MTHYSIVVGLGLKLGFVGLISRAGAGSFFLAEAGTLTPAPTTKMHVYILRVGR